MRVTVWDELVGQQAVVQQLQVAAADAHLVPAGPAMTHAWLMTGPPGSGRSTAALAFAKALMCRNGGCDHCDDCRDIGNGAHPDVEIIRPEGISYRTADARALVTRSSIAPSRGRWHVIVIEDADRMTEAANNVLLKAIEEPPPRAVWLLCSPSVEDVLPTIRSRCRTLGLKPLASADIARVMAANDVKGSAEERAAIANLAEGSAGRALSIAAGGGLDLYREIASLLMGLPKLNVKAVHALADKVARRGADEAYQTTVELLNDWLQRLVKTGAGAAPQADLAPGEGAAMARLAASGGLDRWVEVWEKINQSVARAEALNTDRKLVILNIFSMLESVAGERIGV